MIYPHCDPADLPDDQRHANHETTKRVLAAVADILESERRRCQAAGLIQSWQLSRADLDRAAASLGLPPISDEECSATQATHHNAPDATLPDHVAPDGRGT
ncbi:hypothetical protein GCM10022226_08500 [Sphaerisporangium flaviroseum]|uniref:Uncharacterized protein n=1 Tax=Sphaerisporangium flaviroseum TaxID=509199 RepID=A0ABP7HHA9_9ACTN